MNAELPAVDNAIPALFETLVRVRFHEVDALGHVNNAAYLNYLEQAAIDHATFLGLDLERSRTLGGVFVARRHEILFVRPAFAGDVLRVVTWLDRPTGARVERHYRLFREEEPLPPIPLAGRVRRGATTDPDVAALVVQATTEWVFANDRGQPRRIPGEIIEMFTSRVGARDLSS